ncbi:bifunctional diaminohydroxyphosphoribosylaminopyrimidine deaminase/5-amino-6-(5-phosphoribosylamino)uracil reductase RibD [Calditrichota bacterium]
MAENLDQVYMQRVLALAKFGRGHVSPNPRVGALVVNPDGEVLGEGYHVHYGGPHAEVVALHACKGKDLSHATLYVNLEPCCFKGKTPACTEAVIKSGIKRVVAATKDPHPRVNGLGFATLRDAGIDIIVGVSAEKARYLNRGIFSFHERGRAWCTVKIALSIDGKMSNKDGESKWISGPEARKLAHALRADHDGVLVGGTTVKNDDPELTVRSVRGVNPVRLILSPNSGIPEKSKLSTTAQDVRTVLITGKGQGQAVLGNPDIEVLQFETDDTDKIDPHKLLEALPEKGVLSVLIEGGAKVLSSFMQADVIDEIVVAVAPTIVGKGISPFDGFNPSSWEGRPQFATQAYKRYGRDVVIFYRRESSSFSQD